MKIFILTFLIFFNAQAAEDSLTAGAAEVLLKKIQACSSDKCWNDFLSSEISNLEKDRTRDWLKKFNVEDSKSWYPCKFKLRPQISGEVCFAQPEKLNKDEEVRMIFHQEGKDWRLKHLSLPTPTLGW